MTHEVVMPRLGWTMEAGTVVEWLKRDGEPVAAGEAIFSVEADKGLTDVEALDDGILHIPADSPLGVEVPVGTTLAYIAPAGATLVSVEDSSGPVSPGGPTSEQNRPQSIDSAAPRGGGNGQFRISPRARRRAIELHVDVASLAGSGRSGRIIERDVVAAAARPAVPRPRAAPAVRKLADEAGVGLAQIAATGPAGRVTRSDVRQASHRQPPDGLTEPMGQVRRIVSQRMAEAARTVAPVTLTTEADATELVQVRARLKDELSGAVKPVPSITDLVVRLVALALLEQPDLNASLVDGAIQRHASVHVGIAVDTERGLLVPVVRDAHLKSIHAIAAEAARLIDEARRGVSATEDLSGGTFTVTNLGMFEIDAFTPIINLPESAILGIGRVVARPVVLDEEPEAIVIRKMMALSLTFDHRVVDGGPAARFLQRCKHSIERPFVSLTR
ncbi:MAG: 2-oxo acid dehydrogenase subunit E2 [Chloroflexi bacterium]|nr:2-oxo acid dehydrogenase subunit E2 [Chloroflexota bacterium]